MSSRNYGRLMDGASEEDSDATEQPTGQPSTAAVINAAAVDILTSSSNRQFNGSEFAPIPNSSSSSDDQDMSRLQAMLEARGFPANLAEVLGPRMHHLILNRANTLGSSGISSGSSSKAHQLLAGLQSVGDESRQLQSVIEMSQLLVMGNEDTLTGFPIRQVVPALNVLLKMEQNMDMMINACRALTYMMEALPRSSSVIVEAIPTFLEKLQVIHCMDVAEQALKALEMLSKKHHKAILHARGVVACLMYLEFFSLSAQRSALTITSNCCQGLTKEELVYVEESLPILATRLVHQDRIIAEMACLSISRASESFKNYGEGLRALCRKDIMTNLQLILAAQPPNVSQSTFVSVIHILVIMSSNESNVAAALLKRSIAATLRSLLVVNQLSPNTSSKSQNSLSSSLSSSRGRRRHESATLGDTFTPLDLIQRSPQEMYEITSLIAELMPPLPCDGELFSVDSLLTRQSGGSKKNDSFQWQWQDDTGSWNIYDEPQAWTIEAAHLAGKDEVLMSSSPGKTFTVSLTSMHEFREYKGTARPVRRSLASQVMPRQTPTVGESTDDDEDEDGDETDSDSADGIVNEHLALTAIATRQLLPVLLEVYVASAGPSVRYGCLQATLRMVYHASRRMLLEILDLPTLSSLIAGMLSASCLRSLVGALQISEILLKKLPEEFGVHFRRQGVLHQVQKLTDPDHPVVGINSNVHLTSVSTNGSCVNSINNKDDSSVAISSNQNHCINVDGHRNNSASVSIPHLSWSGGSTGFANIFSDQFRLSKRKDDSPSGTTSAPQNSHLRLSELLKRKRNSKRSCGSRKGRLSDPGVGRYSSSMPIAAVSSGSSSMQSSAPPAINDSLRIGSSVPTSTSTPLTRRSRIVCKTSSILSQLHPSRWVKTGENSTSNTPWDLAADNCYHSRSSESSFNATPPPWSQNREKVNTWIRQQASRLLEVHFKESLCSRHPALTILRRLSGQVDHLSRKPKDGERTLREILSILLENDISPFEVIQSGLVPVLLAYLTSESIPDITRASRLRTFLHVFLGASRSESGYENSSSLPTIFQQEALDNFVVFVQKLNACLNHLEQFPIRMHEVSTNGGIKSVGSTMKFFKTHHLKCSLHRHPDCTIIRSWKGGLVKIDPLALVQAIERYLVSRGYAQVLESGVSDDDMSDEGTDDMLSGLRDSVGLGGVTHRIEFLIGDHVLPYDMTIYQAVQQYGSSAAGWTFDMPAADSAQESQRFLPMAAQNIWTKLHSIYYRLATNTSVNSKDDVTKTSSKICGSKKGKLSSKQSKRKAPDELWLSGLLLPSVDPLGPFLTDKIEMTKISSGNGSLLDNEEEVYFDFPASEHSCLEVLALLRTVHALNRFWGSLYTGLHHYTSVIDTSEFVNAKLTAKINRQLQDPIIIMTSNLPIWLKEVAVACPFLLPFETRQVLFYATSFDRDRALRKLLDSVPEFGTSESGQERVAPDLDRKKRVISRANLLKQAETMFTELAHSRSLLEIQYENEVGTGLGPTLEFYTLISNELQRADLNLWMGERNQIMNVEYIHSRSGLFPLALSRSAKSAQRNKIKSKFIFLGRFLAKAVLDSRMIDMPFSLPFYQWLLRQERNLSIGDLHNIDPSLARTFFQLETIVNKKRKLEEDTKLSAEDLKRMLKTLTLDGGCSIADLGLDFTLPGQPEFELRKGGKDINVTLENLPNYVALVTHWMLNEGVSLQMEAFREGFESVFPVDTLRMFYPEELGKIFCGSTPRTQERWDIEYLADACKPAHGFTKSSRAINFLYHVMASYNHLEQRQFLQFVTGCPRLPVGGFKALSPPLTIVKKSFHNSVQSESERVVNPDYYLPSVMTCVNYLKMPDYTSIEILREKFRIAAMEGQYSFHLS